MMRRYVIAGLLTVATGICAVWMSGTVLADTTDSSVYGSGSFGDCNFGTCTITLTNTGAPSMAVVPTPLGKCTVKSDDVSVLTDSTTGYSLTMTTSTTNSDMQGASASIAASSGTSLAPTTLAMNTWGYRVDGLAAFGAGPTSDQDSGSVPSVTFAGVPASDQSAATVATSSGPANPAETTTTWYGVCADSTVPSDTYSATVVYTAVIN